MTRPTPYIERQDGYLIQAEEWNEIQIQARENLQAHDHSGGERGPRLSYTKLDDVPTEFPPAPHQHSETGSLAIGEGTGKNLMMDADTLMARENGNPSPLQLQPDGGEVVIHANKDTDKQLTIDDDGHIVLGSSADTSITGRLTPSDGGKTGLALFSGEKDDYSSIFMNSDRITIRTPLDEPFQIIDEDNNKTHLQLDNNGNLVIRGRLSQGSSRDLKENIVPLSPAEARATLEQLQPVKYGLREQPAFRQYLGFIAEDLLENLANADRKSMSPSEIIPVLTQVAREQQQTIAALQATVARLETDLQQLRQVAMESAGRRVEGPN